MDFEDSEAEAILRRTVRDFAKKEIQPHARKWDEDETFPHALVPKLAALGLTGMRVPEEYGGAGMSTMDNAIVIEELARVDGSVALTVAAHNGLCTGHILLAGNDEQKKKYLPKLAAGEWLGAWGLTEPSSGSDAAGAKTRAVKKGDRWIINGSKTFITQGSVGSVYVVIASTTPEKKQHGLTAFIVDKGAKGFSVGKHIEKMGCHASDTCELNFVDVEVGDDARLGTLDHGFLDTLTILDRGRISIASMALGLGYGALESAKSYARERKQFGRPIADNQAIQFMLADSATELDGARLLIKRAAWIADQGKRHTYESATAKLWAAQVAMRACDRAIQIHGGYGYTREFPVERALRDCKLCEIGEGTNEVQRMVIARHLIGHN
ncbi:MAG TPA: acyl-CoA dehydrogenase family protein [Polyangia bacterium]|nr:acyl-CoA dehydrogenase family protein [Polyangia bacterium]